jgi:hemolysin activation/secretion protein
VNTPAEYSTLGLRYDTAQLRNHSLNANDSAFYDTRSMGIEFKGFEREMAPGGAVFTYDLRLSKGEVDMNGSPNEQADLSGEKTDGEYSRLKFSGTILQPLGGINAAYFGLTLQRANKNLDASEKLYLGGPLGVRAYGVGEGAGSQGEIANFELRQRLSARTTLAEFYDVGRIRSWENAGVSQRGGTLSGFGLSLSHKLDSDINLKATWARTTGDTPDSSIMPVKSNGEYDRNRFWLSLDARF